MATPKAKVASCSVLWNIVVGWRKEEGALKEEVLRLEAAARILAPC